MPQLGNLERYRVVTLLESGCSVREVEARLGVPKSTVGRIKQKWETELTVARRPGGGAPRKSTPAEDRALRDYMHDHPFADVTYAINVTNFPGSNQTGLRRLRENGIKRYAAAAKENMTQAHKQARLQFAEQYLNQPVDFWQNVVFSDEKVFQSSKDGPVKVYRPQNFRYDERYVHHRTRSGRFSVNMWAWISYRGPGVCWQTEGRLNAEQYRAILENVMVPSVEVLYPDRNYVFQQVSEYPSY